MAIPSILECAHLLAGRGVEPGGLAIDATVGNGHDTLFLVQEVGPGGRVLGFDIQTEALDTTRERVHSEAPEALERLHLVHAGHESMATHLDKGVYGTVGAVMFNLGYLPGGDHSITTEPESTRSALATSAELLRPGGVITIVAYPGHEGGAVETEAVLEWTSSLSQDAFRSLSYRFVNRMNEAPRLFAVEKREGAAGP